MRFTISGMGDALPTMYEALACVRAGRPNMRDARATASSVAWARLCYDMLIKNGAEAVKAVEGGHPTEAFEKTVEATTLLSCLGFENCGVAAAHGLWLGFTHVTRFRDLHLLHGEGVSICALVHLVLEEQPESILREVMNFCGDVGLPLSLHEVGVGDSHDGMVAEGVAATWLAGNPAHNMPFQMTEKLVLGAIAQAEELARDFRGGDYHWRPAGS